jgi:hypothetical protein
MWGLGYLISANRTGNPQATILNSVERFSAAVTVYTYIKNF